MSVTPYILNSLADVFTGGAIDQTAPYKLDMNANNRVSVEPYILNSLADVFTGGAIDQTAPFELDMNANDRVSVKRQIIDKLDTLFDFRLKHYELPEIPISGNVLIDRQKITSLDQVLDLSGLGGINLADLVDIKIGTTDFFFKVADQSDNIRVAIETVFTGIAQDAKATVELSELVDFNSEGLKGVLFQSINDGIADGQIDLATSPQWLSGDTD